MLSYVFRLQPSQAGYLSRQHCKAVFPHAGEAGIAWSLLYSFWQPSSRITHERPVFSWVLVMQGRQCGSASCPRFSQCCGLSSRLNQLNSVSFSCLIKNFPGGGGGGGGGAFTMATMITMTDTIWWIGIGMHSWNPQHMHARDALYHNIFISGHVMILNVIIHAFMWKVNE